MLDDLLFDRKQRKSFSLVIAHRQAVSAKVRKYFRHAPEFIGDTTSDTNLDATYAKLLQQNGCVKTIIPWQQSGSGFQFLTIFRSP